MTREETIKILMTVQAAFPNYKPPDKTVTVNLWCRMLQDYTYQQVEAAVDAYIRTDKSGFAPCIGDIIDKIQMIFESTNQLNEMAAWDVVWNAIKNSGDNERAEKNFEVLPPIIQKTVRSPGQLREWALTQNMNVEVVSSNFMRAYRTEVAREKELKKLSPDLRRLIQEHSRGMITQDTVSKPLLPAEEKEKKAEEIVSRVPDHVKKRYKELFGRGWT